MSKKQERSAVATPRNYSITSKQQNEALMLFDKIGVGKENAIKPDKHSDHNDRIGRELRRLVSEANQNGDAIINDRDGKGYYRPNIDRPEEVASAKHYIYSLLHEADMRQRAADGIAEWLGGRYRNF